METTRVGHTPGPWIAPSAGVWTADKKIMIASAGEQKCLSTLRKMGRDGRETLANVRLIAAAPDLLEACKRSLYALELADQDRDDGGELCGLLRSTIAAAEGGDA